MVWPDSPVRLIQRDRSRLSRSTTIRIEGAESTSYPTAAFQLVASTTELPPPTSYGPRLNRARTSPMLLCPSDSFSRWSWCRWPQVHFVGLTEIRRVSSSRASRIASERIRSRSSTTLSVVESSHHWLSGCRSRLLTTAIQRCPPSGHCDSGSWSWKVSRRRLLQTALKYAAAAESAGWV